MTTNATSSHDCINSPPPELSPDELFGIIIVLSGSVIAARSGARLGAEVGNEGGTASEVLGGIAGAMIGGVIGGLVGIIAIETISTLMDDPFIAG